MWEATLNDGKDVSEKTHKWSEVKKDVKKLKYRYQDIVFEFPEGLSEYSQFKTASAFLQGGQATIESQTIGFNVGEKRVQLRFGFSNKKVILEIK